MAHLQPRPIGRYARPQNGWTCFHCGDTFTTPEEAREHFGPTPEWDPLCFDAKAEHGDLARRLRAAEISALEARMDRQAAEDEADMANARLADLPRLFPGALSPHDAWLEHDHWKSRARAAEDILAQLWKADPEAVQEAARVVCGPGEYDFSSTTPAPSRGAEKG
jgi:hypothetical protein